MSVVHPSFRLRPRLLVLPLLLAALLPCVAADWPQLQGNAARTGRTADTVAPPYRARWIWLGPTQTLRNKDSRTGWNDDLAPRAGYTYPNMPSAVPFTFSDAVQPALASNRLFVGSLEGKAYAIDADDGATAWSTDIPGGTAASAAVAGGTVVFAATTGTVYGLNTVSGAKVWSFTARKAITGAPCAIGATICVADHGGWVYALDAMTGAVAWQARVGAAVLGGLCSDGTDLFLGAEDLKLYAVKLSNGSQRASPRLHGQSFRMLWPVVWNNLVWAHTATTPIIGSEYVMETLMAGSTDLANEEANIARWLSGDNNGGAWADAGADWRHVFALKTGDLSEAFTPLVGPADGVGVPAHPVVVDNNGRVLTYFKTRYPTFTKLGGTFGTKYSIDIAAIDQTNGHRLSIGNGHLANPWPWETDNLYGLSVAGDRLWLRQNFRGTQMLDLAAATGRGVTACVRNRDGGTFNFDVVYRDTAPAAPAGGPGPGQGVATASTPLLGRAAPSTVGTRTYLVENFAVTALEHKP